MSTHEHTANDAIAAALRQTRKTWRGQEVVRSESMGAFKVGNTRPDILVTEPNSSPVAIETEIAPATTVEADAKQRLGKLLSTTGQEVLSTLAVRVPANFRNRSGESLAAEIQSTDGFEIALFTGHDESTAVRWPASGWLRGGLSKLSSLAQAATVPPAIIDKAAEILTDGVSETAALLSTISKTNAGALVRMSELLHQKDDNQTRRMAMTMVANAFVFHETLAGGNGQLASVATLEELRGSAAGLTRGSVLKEWRKILEVNYWPIFDIARRILEIAPATIVHAIIDRMASTAERLVAHKLMRSHDLTGAVFQKLIADRKFLAAFYTLPAAAALLVRLTINSSAAPNGANWGSSNDVKGLRIADFACGTGTLLSAAYQRVGQLHELAGGSSEEIHPNLMAKGIVGCDVLPAATHLTASMLAGTHPTIEYSGSSIFTVPYGKQGKQTVALGSLELLREQANFAWDEITAFAAEATGEAEQHAVSELPHNSFDVVIMNPPFTRPTGHEGEKIGVPIPMFAAFSSSKEEQRLMGKAMGKITQGTCYHGNAGEGSAFLALAERKLRAGGTLAMVLPLSLLAGKAWEEARALLKTRFSELIVVSLAAKKDDDLSFSADSGMGECLLVGKKRRTKKTRATFVVLKGRPQVSLVGAEIGDYLNSAVREGMIPRLEDGPVGGATIDFGSETVGSAINCPLPSTGGWYLSRIADLSLAQAAYQLAEKSTLWLPGMDEADFVRLRMTTIGTIGTVGPYHADINAVGKNGALRGPFVVRPLASDEVPTYPVLWSHDADRERGVMFEADCEGKLRTSKSASVKKEIAKRVREISRSASHCHYNRDFRFNSQSTCFQFCERKTIGGRAWPSIALKNAEQEKALVLWGNTTPGVFLYWWMANKQQAGRGSIGITSIPTMPTLDVTILSAAQLEKVNEIFKDMKNVELRPINEMDVDEGRAKLDRRFLVDVVGVPRDLLDAGGPIDVLRKKLAREPSIAGAKSAEGGDEETAADDEE